MKRETILVEPILLLALTSLMVFSFVTATAMAQTQVGALTRQDTQGEVSVTLTYLNPLKGLDEKELVFEVAMNTHTVDLDAYDFAKVLVLKDDKGNLYNALGVEAPKGGGHHRGGVVKFPGVTGDGKSILQGAAYFEILVKGVGVPERALRWELPIK